MTEEHDAAAAGAAGTATGAAGIAGAPDEETVAYITGNGYKTIDALEGTLEPTYRIAPDLDEFLAALGP